VHSSLLILASFLNFEKKRPAPVRPGLAECETGSFPETGVWGLRSDFTPFARLGPSAVAASRPHGLSNTDVFSAEVVSCSAPKIPDSARHRIANNTQVVAATQFVGDIHADCLYDEPMVTVQCYLDSITANSADSLTIL